MGVKVREKHPGSGVWWIYIDHQGKRKSKKIGRDKKLAIEAAKKIEARLTLGDIGIIDGEAVPVPTLREYVYGWKDEEGGQALIEELDQAGVSAHSAGSPFTRIRQCQVERDHLSKRWRFHLRLLQEGLAKRHRQEHEELP